MATPSIQGWTGTKKWPWHFCSDRPTTIGRTHTAQNIFFAHVEASTSRLLLFWARKFLCTPLALALLFLYPNPQIFGSEPLHLTQETEGEGWSLLRDVIGPVSVWKMNQWPCFMGRSLSTNTAPPGNCPVCQSTSPGLLASQCSSKYLLSNLCNLWLYGRNVTCYSYHLWQNSFIILCVEALNLPS